MPKEDGGFARAEKIKDPVAPALWEATVAKDQLKAVPVDRVKCFVEVELKYNSWSRPTVAAVENVSSINKIVSKGAPRDEACLIATYQSRNKRL